jgi:hypothetical protein
MISNILKKYHCIFLILGVVFILINLLFFIFYVVKDGKVVIQFYLRLLERDLLWNIITALSTLLAALFALFAYIQSKKLKRMTSFDALFTQLIANLNLFIQSKTLIEPTYTIGNNFVKAGVNAFLIFCQVYEDITRNRMVNELEIRKIWDVYTNSLQSESNFLNCFKYIYHLVEVVIDSPLSEKQKIQYIGIIQSHLNLDILFCYLINQMVANGFSKTGYSQKMKQYKFFENLEKDYRRYGKLVKSTIPVYVYKEYLS